ncbi:hypothetical protein Lal_00003586 [Lupinus albus]|nr:hypothetical protein Lal_00003586 [Lupinus albus]
MKSKLDAYLDEPIFIPTSEYGDNSFSALEWWRRNSMKYKVLSMRSITFITSVWITSQLLWKYYLNDISFSYFKYFQQCKISYWAFFYWFWYLWNY